MDKALNLWGQFFLRASLRRVYVEMIALAVLLTVFAVLIYGSMAAALYAMALLFFINPLCGLYYALRLKPAPGGKWRQFGIETFWLSTVAIALSLWSMVATLIGANSTPTLAAVLIILVVMIFPFVFFRVLVRLWVWWQRLRERRLIYSLMHSHLMAVALLQAVVIVPVVMLMTAATDTGWTETYLPGNPVAQFFYRFNITLPLVGLSILASMVVLIALLPASAVVSYFFARRTKKRLDALIDAAHAARDGDYRTRVAVSGGDEIATLQADFNTMIASLENNVQALRDEREKVAELLRLRRELIASVSHELRTPIATIRAYLEAAQRRNDGLHADDFATIQRETEALQTLIDDLFALSRAEADHLSLSIEPTALPELIERVVETVAPLAWRGNRVEVSAQVPAWLPPVQADPKRLEQSLLNLIHNSLRHTLPGGLVVITAAEQGDFAEIQVRDTGEGIAQEDLPHIWERFYRGASNGGSGLGLALVKSFVEAMGGSVGVESAPGEGACFTIRLPLSEIEPQRRKDAEKNPEMDDETPLPRPQPVVKNSHQ